MPIPFVVRVRIRVVVLVRHLTAEALFIYMCHMTGRVREAISEGLGFESDARAWVM